MKYGNIILEKREYVYLKRILNITSYTQDVAVQKSVQRLVKELENAQVLDEQDMPLDVIRFNSIVTVKTSALWEREFQLVIPTDEDLKQNKISVLKPMGTALIGYAQSDVIEWDLPAGTQQLQILNVMRDANYSPIDITI